MDREDFDKWEKRFLEIHHDNIVEGRLSIGIEDLLAEVEHLVGLREVMGRGKQGA